MSKIADIAGSIRSAWVSRDEPESIRTLARAFWVGTLVFATLLSIGFSLYAGFTFFTLLKPSNETTPSVEVSRGIAFDRHELQELLRGFEMRKAQYESIQTKRPSIADPSR